MRVLRNIVRESRPFHRHDEIHQIPVQQARLNPQIGGGKRTLFRLIAPRLGRGAPSQDCQSGNPNPEGDDRFQTGPYSAAMGAFARALAPADNSAIRAEARAIGLVR